ncbi:MAG: alpha-L-arabinofuranosidase C-terminal domain-containing protein [Lactococcus hircilactis]
MTSNIIRYFLVFWFHSKEADESTQKNNPWQVAPQLLEDVYTLEDALLVGLMLITILKNANRIKMACMAQLVNVIAPIMSDANGGKVWKQTTFYPFMHTSRFGRGVVLQPVLTSTKHKTENHDAVTDVESVAVWNEENEELTIFAVNRNLEDNVCFEVDLRGMEGYFIKEHIIVTGPDLKATNSSVTQSVFPKKSKKFKQDGGRLESILEKASWNVLRFEKKNV